MLGRLRWWEGAAGACKPYSLRQDEFIAISYGDQVVPGFF